MIMKSIPKVLEFHKDSFEPKIVEFRDKKWFCIFMTAGWSNEATIADGLSSLSLTNSIFDMKLNYYNANDFYTVEFSAKPDFHQFFAKKSRMSLILIDFQNPIKFWKFLSRHYDITSCEYGVTRYNIVKSTKNFVKMPNELQTSEKVIL